MSIVQEVFYILSNYPGGYRTLYNIIYDSQPPGSKKENERRENTLRTTLSRLRSKGLIQKNNKKWALSEEGRALLESRGPGLPIFSPPRRPKNKVDKSLIVIFDIPEKQRKYRDWLRTELIGFGFECVQKSVWFGPALPKGFVEYLDNAGLLEYVRFFKASKEDLI